MLLKSSNEAILTNICKNRHIERFLQIYKTYSIRK